MTIKNKTLAATMSPFGKYSIRARVFDGGLSKVIRKYLTKSTFKPW